MHIQNVLANSTPAAVANLNVNALWQTWKLVLLLAIGILLWPAQEAQASLLAHWSFDSNLQDPVGGNDLTATGDAAVTNVVGNYIVGTGALTLDGTGDFATAIGFKGVTGTTARTMSVWTTKSAFTRLLFGQNGGSSVKAVRRQATLRPRAASVSRAWPVILDRAAASTVACTDAALPELTSHTT